MFFPNLKDVATKDVVLIESSSSLEDATQLMKKNDIRNIVVIDDKRYKLITANTLIKCNINKIDFNTKLHDIDLDSVPIFKADTNVLEALSQTDENDHYICVMEQGVISGIVTHADIISSIDPEKVIKKQKIKEILKLHNPQTVDFDTPLADVLPMLEKHTHESVIILKEHKPVGILTTKDTIAIFASQSDLRGPVSKYMKSPLQTVSYKTTIKEAIDYINEKKFSRVIVVDENDELLGVITQKELIAFSYNRWTEIVKNHESGLMKINKMLEKKTKTLEIMATTDLLTGTYNRNKFNDLIEAEISRSKRYMTPLSVIMLDIDHFKKVNDTHGHLAGDEILEMVAKTVKEHVRKTDIVARWGGEEFVIILPQTDLGSAFIVAEKIRKGIEETKFKNIHRVTISLGVAEAEKSENKDSILERVDKALYHAKNNGRNRASTQNDIKDKTCQ